MKQFSEMNIKPDSKGFVGNKIKVSKVLNQQITVHDYKITDSKYPEKTEKCLYLQIEVKGIKHVIFTGSMVLMGMIQKVARDDFPFETKIVEENDRYEFS